MEDGNKEAAGRVGWTGQPMDMEKAAGGGNGNDGGRKPAVSIVRLFLACMVSGGIQYGWALQLSLLSPYSQVLYAPPFGPPSPSACLRVHVAGFVFALFPDNMA